MDLLLRSHDCLELWNLDTVQRLQGDLLQRIYLTNETIVFDRHESTCSVSHDKCSNTRKFLNLINILHPTA